MPAGWATQADAAKSEGGEEEDRQPGLNVTLKLFLLCVSGAPLVTRVTLSCLMENVLLTVRTYASFEL